jgi:Kdo2-lipid IVA lauroyltransferase/acyltransferase
MRKIGNFLLFGLMWLLALLPLRILYIFSDVLYYKLYYLFRYRRKVVRSNLMNSFPDKDAAWIKATEKKYYRHLADLVIEFIKIRHITREQITKRMRIINPDILQTLYSQQKSIFVAIGHCGNWEWLGQKMANVEGHRPFAIFKPLTNPYFDKYMRNLRVRFHAPNLIEFKKTYRIILQNIHTVNAIIIAADQTPTRNEINYWTNFLNQDTPFFLGIEKMSKSLDYAVLFFDMTRIRRGYYEIEIKPVTISPRDTKPFEITEKYVSLLEEAIHNNPSNWLWSHRRWKHKREST